MKGASEPQQQGSCAKMSVCMYKGLGHHLSMALSS